jgi:hypothetical protein
MKKEARLKTLTEIAANPLLAPHVNPKGVVEEMLRSGAELTDSEIAVLMDVKNYGNKEEVARAHKAIQEIRQGRKVELFHGATSLFLEIIHNWANDHRSSIGEEKYLQYQEYLQAHAELAVENTMRKARDDAMQKMAAPGVPMPEPTAPTDMETPLVPSVSQLANQAA